MLVDRGAALYHSTSGWNPFMMAYISSQLRVRSPLHRVVDTFRSLSAASVVRLAGNGDITALKRLLPKSDVNKADKFGWTCLHAAAFFSRSTAMELLLESKWGIHINTATVRTIHSLIPYRNTVVLILFVLISTTVRFMCRPKDGLRCIRQPWPTTPKSFSACLMPVRTKLFATCSVIPPKTSRHLRKPKSCCGAMTSGPRNSALLIWPNTAKKLSPHPMFAGLLRRVTSTGD